TLSAVLAAGFLTFLILTDSLTLALSASIRFKTCTRSSSTAIDGSTPSILVFLWEKNVEAAWKEAKEGGCKADLWRQLAKLAGVPGLALVRRSPQIKPSKVGDRR
ncbi:MAG: hypothetical protein ACETWQ_20925, partial [Phycisphaerae bacterium]